MEISKEKNYKPNLPKVKEKKKSILINANIYEGLQYCARKHKFKIKPLVEQLIKNYVNFLEDNS